MFGGRCRPGRPPKFCETAIIARDAFSVSDRPIPIFRDGDASKRYVCADPECSNPDACACRVRQGPSHESAGRGPSQEPRGRESTRLKSPAACAFFSPIHAAAKIIRQGASVNCLGGAHCNWLFGDCGDGAIIRMSRRIVESAERCAIKADDLRRRLRR